jgi:hypothetical protein
MYPMKAALASKLCSTINFLLLLTLCLKMRKRRANLWLFIVAALMMLADYCWYSWQENRYLFNRYLADAHCRVYFNKQFQTSSAFCIMFYSLAHWLFAYTYFEYQQVRREGHVPLTARLLAALIAGLNIFVPSELIIQEWKLADPEHNYSQTHDWIMIFILALQLLSCLVLGLALRRTH